MWKCITVNSVSHVGRQPAHNTFSPTPRIKPFVQNKIDSPLSAWQLLVTKNILKTTQKHTTEKAKSASCYLPLTLDKLDAFIGIIYL
jgi:hypothetical protein